MSETVSDAGAAAEPRRERRPFYVRIAMWGFVLIPGSLLLGAFAGNVSSAFVLVPLLPFAALAAVGLRFSSRLFVLTPAWLLSIGVMLASIGSDALSLAHIESSTDFIPALVRATGWMGAVIGTTFALVQRLRRSLRTSRRPERVALAGICAAVLALGTVSFAKDLTTRGYAGEYGGAIIVEARDDAFEPDEITLPMGETVQVLVRNIDRYAHTFTIDELNIDSYVGPGANKLISISVPAPAGSVNKNSRNLRLYCAVTGHTGMTGKVHVR